MTIRLAEEKDIPIILELLRQVGQVHYRIRPDLFRSDALKYDQEALETQVKDALRPIFVAVEGDLVLGYCFCVHVSYSGHPIFVDRKEMYIEDLCVDEKFRGSGVASALYQHVRNYAKEQGCDVIALNVWQGNGQAQRFYEKMGMTQRNITMEQPL